MFVRYFFAFLIIFSIKNAYSQIAELELESPNNKLEHITLQLHKNLPRVGQLYSFGAIEFSFNGTDQEQRKSYLKTKREEFKYNLLLEMKLLSEYYDKLNLKQLLRVIRNNNDHDHDVYKALVAQNHLRIIAYNLVTEEYFPNYFCIPDKECKRYSRPSEQLTINRWGGNFANEFDQHKQYLSFIEDNNYYDIKKWSSSLLDEVYLVKLIRIDHYDFKKGEFPIEISLPEGYTPVDENGKDLNIRGGTRAIKASIKMNEKDAEEFMSRKKNNRKLYPNLFAVSKIKYFGFHYGYLSTSRYKPILKLYHLTDPVIEFYADEALSKKLGEVIVK